MAGRHMGCQELSRVTGGQHPQKNSFLPTLHMEPGQLRGGLGTTACPEDHAAPCLETPHSG